MSHETETLPIPDPKDLPDHFENWWASSDFHQASAETYTKRKQLAWDAYHAASMRRGDPTPFANVATALSELVEACHGEVLEVFRGEIGAAMRKARGALATSAGD